MVTGKSKSPAKGKRSKLATKKTAKKTPKKAMHSPPKKLASVVSAVVPKSGFRDTRPLWLDLRLPPPPTTTLPSSDELGVRLAPMTQPKSGSELKPLTWQIKTSMDPRLQLAVANRRCGKPGLALTSASSDEIAVIAKVRDVGKWEALSDVVPGSNLGMALDGNWIVTARVPVNRAEAIRQESTVVSLKASQPVHPTLAATVQAMEVGSFSTGIQPDGGSKVVVGIVDFGCDFVHKNFRKKDGSSRLLTIWNQGAAARPESPFGYGRRYDKPEIDAALKTTSPYARLGYGPASDPNGTHGTHVMDIAAGNGLGSGQPGVAPNADLIFVEVSTTDIAWQGPDTVNRAFGDSVQLLEAVRFIFDEAGERPCVCNLSLGTNGGPHDGTSLVEQGLDALVREKDNRAVVIAASNSQNDNIHTSGTVPNDAPHLVPFTQIADKGGEIEFWYPGNRRLEVSLIAPDGTVFGPVAPGTNLPVGANGQIAIFISSRLGDPNNHDNVIGIWVAEGLSGDQFTVQLRSLDNEPVDYHAWVERNDRAQASFASPVATHNLGSISTGRESVVVGSYDGHKPSFPLSSFSSAGPTRDGRQKPEVSAPGHAVVAAKSGTVDAVVRKSGTSMAAPAVTGLVALIYGEATRSGRSLPIDALRQILLDHVAFDPPVGGAAAWDPRYGRGRANGHSVGAAPPGAGAS